jgi:hypothetical protein
MKVFSVLTSLTLASSIAFSFDISGFASDALKTAT